MTDLVVSDLHKRLGDTQALRGVSFRLRRGEVVALLGPSGSGKTTLLRAVAGLERPDRGRIALGDRVLFDADAGVAVSAEHRNLGLVFQSYALWPHRSVFDNVAYGLRVRGTAPAEIRDRVVAVLARIGLGALADRHPHQLSGGQQQRVALARALVYNPELLLLDEPLSNLDTKLREEARAWLRDLISQLRISAVCVTHDQVEALAIADRIVLLELGEVRQDGSPQEMYGNPGTLFAAEFMGSNNVLHGDVADLRGDLVRIVGDGWALWGTARGALRTGDPATAVIRLERTQLVEAHGDDVLPATVETELYLGERWDVVLRAGALRFRAWSSAPTAGTSSRLARFPPDALWVFPARAAGG